MYVFSHTQFQQRENVCVCLCVSVFVCEKVGESECIYECVYSVYVRVCVWMCVRVCIGGELWFFKCTYCLSDGDCTWL